MIEKEAFFMITQIYLLFNKELNLISKAPYVVGGNLKQGSDFDLNIFTGGYLFY